MAKKKKRITLRASDRPNTSEDSTKEEPKKEKPELEETEQEKFKKSKSSLIHDLKALSKERLGAFLSSHLGLVGMDNIKDVCVHIETTCRTIQAVEYIKKELEDFLTKEKNIPENKNDVSEESESESEDEAEPDWIPEAATSEELPEMESFDSEDAEEKFKRLKAYVENYLNRIEILEARVDKHDEKIDTIRDRLMEAVDAIKEIKDFTSKQLEELTKIILTKGGGGSGNAGVFRVKFSDPQKVEKEMQGVFPAEWERILQLTSNRINTLLVGPAGCGKTYIAKKVSEAFDLRFAAQSCSEGMDESIFSGMLLPLGDNGQFEYVPSTFVDYYENGGVYLLDEIDGSDGNLMVFINSALGNEYFYLPRRYKNPLVKRHPDFVCIAAANTFGHGGDDIYAARNALDGATLDRFRAGIVKMDYDPAVEKAIIDEDVYNWGIWIRKAIVALKQNKILSTRVMLDFSKLKVNEKWDINKIQNTYFEDWKKDDVTRVNSWINNELEAMESRLKSAGNS